jgi:hypothetical protein
MKQFTMRLRRPHIDLPKLLPLRSLDGILLGEELVTNKQGGSCEGSLFTMISPSGMISFFARDLSTGK